LGEVEDAIEYIVRYLPDKYQFIEFTVQQKHIN